MALASIEYYPTASGGSVFNKWSCQSANFQVLKVGIHEASHHSRVRLNAEASGHEGIYNLLRQLHFNNVLSSLKTSVGGESRYPSKRCATWRHLCPRTIGEYIHLWRTPSSPPPLGLIATTALITQAGCFDKESSSNWQQTTAWRHNLEKGDQTESHYFYFYKMDPDTEWHKKTGTFEKPNKNWRNPRKKNYWRKLNHYNLPFKRQ